MIEENGPGCSTSATAISAKKARMLITILGPEFTRKTNHPFFRNLSEAAAKPVLSDEHQPDISKALKNLMNRLQKDEKHESVKAGARLVRNSRDNGVGDRNLQNGSAEFKIDERQHPALLAKKLLSRPVAERTAKLKSLSQPIARRVVIYMRELNSTRPV